METPPALHKPLDLVYLHSRTGKRESEIQRDVPLRPLPSRSVGLGELGPRSRCSTGLTQMPRTGNAAISRPAETAWSLCFIIQEPGRIFTCRQRIQLNSRVGSGNLTIARVEQSRATSFHPVRTARPVARLGLGLKFQLSPFFVPNPASSVSTATTENLGLLFSRRNAKRKS